MESPEGFQHVHVLPEVEFRIRITALQLRAYVSISREFERRNPTGDFCESCAIAEVLFEDDTVAQDDLYSPA